MTLFCDQKIVYTLSVLWLAASTITLIAINETGIIAIVGAAYCGMLSFYVHCLHMRHFNLNIFDCLQVTTYWLITISYILISCVWYVGSVHNMAIRITTAFVPFMVVFFVYIVLPIIHCVGCGCNAYIQESRNRLRYSTV